MALKSVAYKLDENLLELLDSKSKELGCSKRFLIEKGLKMVLGEIPIERTSKTIESEKKPSSSLIEKFRAK
jgi:hypothetical protein